jgi:hypothetical protein
MITRSEIFLFSTRLTRIVSSHRLDADDELSVTQEGQQIRAVSIKSFSTLLQSKENSATVFFDPDTVSGSKH